MVIDFQVGTTAATLRRDWLLGGMRITTRTRRVWLQHPLDPRTHFSLRLKQSWRCEIEGQDVVVEKERPLLVAGARAQHFRVFVDGRVVAEASGY